MSEKISSSLVLGITGATGTLGKKFVKEALLKGYTIRCLVRDNENTKKLKNKLEKYNNVEYIYGDLNDTKSLFLFLKNIDICIHMAAHVGYATKYKYNKINTLGTENLCQVISKINPTCHLVYISTIAILERFKWRYLNTNYSNSKYDAEKKVKDSKLEVSYVYPGIIYGPEDLNFIPTLLSYLRSGYFPLVSGGDKYAPLIYIGDMCDLIFFSIKNRHANSRKYIGVGQQELGIHDFIKKLSNEMQYTTHFLTIPKGFALSIAVFMEAIYDLFKLRKFPFISKRSVDILSIKLAPELVRQYNLGRWKAKVDLNTGIRNTLFWYKNQQGRLD